MATVWDPYHSIQWWFLLCMYHLLDTVPSIWKQCQVTQDASTKPQCFMTANPIWELINLLTQRLIRPLIQPPALGALASGKRLIWETAEIKKDRFRASGERLCQYDSGVALHTRSCCFASLALSVKAILVKRKSKKADTAHSHFISHAKEPLESLLDWLFLAVLWSVRT